MKKALSGKLAMLLAGATLAASLTGCMSKTLDDSASDFGYVAHKVNVSNLSARSLAAIHSAAIRIPESQAAVYTCTVVYEDGDTTVLKLGDTELIMMTDGLFRVGGSITQAALVPGTYGVKVTVNPSQLMLMVDITLPDGGSMRRGGYSLFGRRSLTPR